MTDGADALFERADGSMIVATMAAPSGLFGCLAGFHTQVSIEPFRYAVCLSHENATFHATEDAGGAGRLGVNLLAESQLELAALFGETTADDAVDKFSRCRWQRDEDDPPILDGVVAWLVGDIVDRVPMGDHTAFVLEPVRAAAGVNEPPLRYHAARRLDAGH